MEKDNVMNTEKKSVGNVETGNVFRKFLKSNTEYIAFARRARIGNDPVNVGNNRLCNTRLFGRHRQANLKSRD